MITALDQTQEKAVLGVDEDTKRKGESVDPGQYRCLLCGSELSYTINPDNLFEFFVHDDSETECINDGNVSKNHRLGQEVVCKRIFNTFPSAYHPLQLGIEARVGGPADFVVSDVRMSSPFRIAVEIVYLSNYVSLRRRLKTLFLHDYRVMVVVVTGGRVSADRAEHHLQKLAPIQVGRFDPDSLQLKLGSLIDSEQIDPDTARWDLLPNYLS